METSSAKREEVIYSMCGLAGVIAYKRCEMPSASRMIATLSRRGPDATAVWEEDNVSLGHSRLAIVDQGESGRQPMISHDGRFVISFNGEIYNFKILKKILEDNIGDIIWNGTSDTEVFLEYIVHYGLKEALLASEGMFAFGLWDRQKKNLLLARDRAGEKPLYYGWVDSCFVFGSELKALRALSEFVPVLSGEAEAAFYRYGHVPNELCIYENVRKLKPGSFLSWCPSDGQHWPEQFSWWSLSEYGAHSDHDMFSAIEEVDVELHVCLRQAVEQRINTELPVGVFLSGGIDSALITALMTQLSERTIPTFTIGFDDTELDESTDATNIAMHLGTRHETINISPQDAREVSTHLSDAFDEPFSDSSQIPTLFLSRSAKKSVSIALSGDGGDELFGGYNRHSILPRIHSGFGQWPQFLRNLIAAGLDQVPEYFITWMLGQLGYPKHLSQRKDDLSSLLRVSDRPDALYYTALNGKISYYYKENNNIEFFSDYQSWIMKQDFENYLPDGPLTKIDRASMYSSLETRCPFLDSNVIRVAQKVPQRLRVDNGISKQPLRRLLGKYLPDELINSTKSGFTPPIGMWLRTTLRPWAEEMLLQDYEISYPALPKDKILRMWARHKNGQGDFSRFLWPEIIYRSWMHRWL